MITVRAGSTAIGICLLLLTAGCSREQQDWRSAEAADSIDSYGQFIQRHPDSELVTQARARVAQLGEDRDWQRAGSADTVEAYREFIAQHPNGKWSQEAHIRIENFSLGEQAGTDAGTKVAAGAGSPGGEARGAPTAGSATTLGGSAAGASGSATRGGGSSAAASGSATRDGGSHAAAGGSADASARSSGSAGPTSDGGAHSYGLAQPGEAAAPARGGAPASAGGAGLASAGGAALSSDDALGTRGSRIIPGTPAAAVSPAAVAAMKAQIASKTGSPAAAAAGTGSGSATAASFGAGPASAATPRPSGAASASAATAAASGAPPSSRASMPAAAGSATAGTAKGGFGIQLGAYSNEASASAQWRVLTARYASELQGLQQHVVPADTGSGRIYRLQAAVGDESRARAICDQLKKHGQACVAVLPH